MRKYSYSSTLTENLWTELSKIQATNGKTISVENLMENWVKKEGFPIVTIKQLENGSLFLMQDRFLKDFESAGVRYCIVLNTIF